MGGGIIVIEEAKKGVLISISAALSCWKVKKVRIFILKTVWAVFLTVILTRICTSVLLFLPRFILILVGLVVPTAWEGQKALGEWSTNVGIAIGRVAGPFAVALMRYIIYTPLETAFFDSLEAKDPEFANSLKSKKPRSFWDTFPKMVLSAVRSLLVSPFALLLKVLVPGGGTLLATYFLYRAARRYTSRPAAMVAAVAVGGLLRFPPRTQGLLQGSFQVFLSQMFIFDELMLPYLSRLRLTRAGERALVYGARLPLALGFLLPYAAAFALPYVGAFSWLVAFPAAAHLALEVERRGGAAVAGDDDGKEDRKKA